MRVHRPRARCPTALVVAVALGCGRGGQVGPTSQPGNPDPPAAGWFRDVTDEAGVTTVYRNGEEADRYAILESLGGGVAVLDYDGDGRLDLFFPGGGLVRRAGQETDPRPAPEAVPQPRRVEVRGRDRRRRARPVGRRSGVVLHPRRGRRRLRPRRLARPARHRVRPGGPVPQRAGRGRRPAVPGGDQGGRAARPALLEHQRRLGRPRRRRLPGPVRLPVRRLVERQRPHLPRVLPRHPRATSARRRSSRPARTPCTATAATARSRT